MSCLLEWNCSSWSACIISCKLAFRDVEQRTLCSKDCSTVISIISCESDWLKPCLWPFYEKCTTLIACIVLIYRGWVWEKRSIWYINSSSLHVKIIPKLISCKAHISCSSNKYHTCLILDCINLIIRVFFKFARQVICWFILDVVLGK